MAQPPAVGGCPPLALACGEHVSIPLALDEQRSWVPSATTRPSSSSTTRSASAIVAGRWAITIVVRPRITSASASRISCSFVGSTDDGGVVEDQHTRVGEDRPGDRDALALPTRQREAALADLGVVAVGQLRR